MYAAETRFMSPVRFAPTFLFSTIKLSPSKSFGPYPERYNISVANIVGGDLKFTPGADNPKALEYGKSITDGCIGWTESLELLESLSQAVHARRN